MAYDLALFDEKTSLSLREKIALLPWPAVLLITAIACIGFAMLYSAASGHFDPWASRQMTRFGLGCGLMLVVALIDIRLWMKSAYLLFAAAVVLLIAVEAAGSVGKGAQRWLDLGFFQLQPSELMKIALVIALARFFHGKSYEDIGQPLMLIFPLGLIAVPTILILRQPDLGTALMLLAVAGAILFLAGVRLWKFAVVAAGVLAAIPLVWMFALHDYQRARVLTFLDPEKDPLNSGYHIIQSKIALGSGGISGKGFLGGSQSHLNFLPEKQTDFIFPLFAEEFGLLGCLVLLALYMLLIAYGFAVSLRSRNQFGRLLGLGVTCNFFLYVFINIAMVVGLIPVVGVPLPLISFGGSAMLTVLLGFGFLFNVAIHREAKISQNMLGVR